MPTDKDLTPASLLDSLDAWLVRANTLIPEEGRMPTDERTNEQISAALAERLFNIRICPDCTQAGDPHTVNRAEVIEPFASDHTAALALVVPEMRGRGYYFELADMSDGGVRATFGKQGSQRVWIARTPFGLEPRAICLAAEAALDAERKES